MTLNFPNRSRSYDEAEQRIRFIGHDGMTEVRFSVEVAAFAKAKSDSDSAEDDYLAAFDAARVSIHDAARSAYAGSRKPLYVLTPSDFR